MQKQKNLIRVANEYLESKQLDLEVRFDIISVIISDDKHTINHCAWTAAGSHFILQMKENELMLVKNPFLHH